MPASSSLWTQFIFTFIPLFIVMDALGNLPFVVSMSEGMTRGERSRLINIALITATILGLFFLLLGTVVLHLMGISVGSFAIAGGVVLVVLSIRNMVYGHMVEVVKEEIIAVVPIGTPLVVGPATITTLILLGGQYPIYMVLISFILNIGITWLVFNTSGIFLRLLGKGGLRAVPQVLSLILAAIGVNMVLRGLVMVGIPLNLG